MAERESDIMRRIQIRASELGWRLFRNHVGVLFDHRGNRVTVGLGVGSSDLIGWRPLLITPQHVGQTIAQFAAVEVKAPRGRVSDSQALFLSVVDGFGGFSQVARGEGDLPE